MANTLYYEAKLDEPSLPRSLRSLSSWELDPDLAGVDLNLSDRSRVSALPWRGQFSPETAERLLDSIVGEGGSRLLDPFVGSGTSLIEAARRGWTAVGIDINPVAVAFARAAELATFSIPERERLLSHLSDVAASLVKSSPDKLFAPDSIDHSHTLALLAHLDGGFTNDALDRALSRYRQLVDSLPRSATRIEVRHGDARRTLLNPRSFDVVLTSPPYINVFNYHQYGRPLTDLFGWNVLRSARAEIGSNRQNRQNRFRTVVQYSLDMALAIRELQRVLNSRGVAIVVVGRESRVRGVPFFNGEILARLVTALGAFACTTRAQRVFTSRYGGRIFEDILVLRSPSATVANQDDLEIARAIAVETLADTRTLAPTRNPEIQAVIKTASMIQPSPFAV